MLVISSSYPSVVTGICDPNKFPARHHYSYKHGWKLKNLSGRRVFEKCELTWVLTSVVESGTKVFEITSMQKNQGISENSDRHDSLKVQWGKQLINSALHKKWSFPLRNSSVNVTKSTVSFRFGHSYWRNPYWKLHFLCSAGFTILLLQIDDCEVGKKVDVPFLRLMWLRSLKNHSQNIY